MREAFFVKRVILFGPKFRFWRPKSRSPEAELLISVIELRSCGARNSGFQGTNLGRSRWVRVGRVLQGFCCVGSFRCVRSLRSPGPQVTQRTSGAAQSQTHTHTGNPSHPNRHTHAQTHRQNTNTQRDRTQTHTHMHTHTHAPPWCSSSCRGGLERSAS